MEHGQKLTAQQIHRTLDALAQTRRLLAKEMAYSPDLRKNDVVARYEAHIARLIKMVETATFVAA